jgi:hypothetical protein
MSAEVTYACLLPDQELRAHLARRDTLLFQGLGRQWQQIEHQVERLGFGELYLVSKRGSKPGSIKVKPLHARSSTAGAVALL